MHGTRIINHVTGLTKEEVARASGVTVAATSRYIGSGLLTPDSSGALNLSDIARVRLITSLEQAGLSLEELSEAIAAGRLSLSYVDQLMPEPVRLVTAQPEISELSMEWEDRVGPVLGPRRGPDEPIREDDLAILRLFARALDIGIPANRLGRLIRAFALTASRLVDLQREFVDEVLLEPAIAGTGSPIAALEATSSTRLEYRKMGRELIRLLMDRFVDDAIFRNLVSLTELALEESGVGPTRSDEAVVFVDMSGYTRLSEEHGDEIAAAQASLLTAYVQDLSRVHGCRLVKSLGDGALIHAPDAWSGLNLALEAVDGAVSRGLWPLHASINMGPMVQRDGDLFGTVVNVASRVAAEAEAGQVVTTSAVMEHLASTDPGVAFAPLGELALRNVGTPVAIFRVSRV